jgi:3-keto-L-gulonate-6-phosphate decarboxylase
MDTTEPLISSSNLDPEKDRTFYYENINFEEIDDDLATFQEDEMVQQALHRGVDLKKYGAELEKELRNVFLLLFS